MKCFAVITLIVVFSAVVMSHPDDPEMRKTIEECNKQHNVSPKDFEDFMHGKSTISDDIKCSMHCTMIKQGLMDDAGTFNPDIAKSKGPKDDRFTAAVDACKDLTGSSPCDKAFKISECLKSHK